MKIYVASSWRNPYQPKVVHVLRLAGHEVYDFRNPPNGSGFGWEQLGFPEKPLGEARKWSADVYRQALQHPVTRAGYLADVTALRDADCVVYVLPCGKSASWELGYSMGAGKPGFVLQLAEEEPELMFRECQILASYTELARAFG